MTPTPLLDWGRNLCRTFSWEQLILSVYIGLLVELETAQSDVTLRDENQLHKHGRKGVSQIEEWREWLLQNLDYARRSRREKGLGTA